MAAAHRDRVVRAITDDNAFRVITLRSTDTVRGVLEAQAAVDRTAERCGELVTGAVLVRETMAPDLRVQAIVKGASGSLVADAHPNGLTRGLVNLSRDAGELTLGAEGMLQVVRTLPRGDVHQGVVEVKEDRGIAHALTSYMQHSEQVVSVVGVACVVEGSLVRAAGGYIVQLLPEMETDALERMTRRLEAIRPVAEAIVEYDADPDRLLSELLDGIPFTRVNESPIHFGCTCDLARVVGALATLGLEEIRELVQQEEILDVGCDYCGKRYQVGPSQLRGLLQAS
ncbi:MAG: Hsp33 family molecular chaperone HslO [Deltaproteobacteria bacterium]|nr:Hsp33 family molecular chaperone HslO [Deltaproteobacteria bacterium]